MDKTDRQIQERSEVFAWLRGGDTTPDPVMEERFLDMVAEAVIERTGLRRRGKVNTAPLSIKAILESCGITPEDMGSLNVPVPPKVKEVHMSSQQEEEHDGWEVDSVTVAKVLCHMAYLGNWTACMSHIQLIMYIAYGVWLARKNDRLFNEHAQVWQFGPVFPKVYNAFKRGFNDSVEVYEKFREEYPEQFRFLERVFKRFGCMTVKALTAEHTADDSPWMETKRNNPDKLGIRIEDDLIAAWFRQRM